MSEKNVDKFIKESINRGGLSKKSAEKMKNACLDAEKRILKRDMTESEYLHLKMNVSDIKGK